MDVGSLSVSGATSSLLVLGVIINQSDQDMEIKSVKCVLLEPLLQQQIPPLTSLNDAV